MREARTAGKAGGSGGGGGGVGIEQAAFIIQRGGMVTVVAMPDKRGALAETFEQVPDLLERLMSARRVREAERAGDDEAEAV